MNLVYIDESGNTGLNLKDSQPTGIGSNVVDILEWVKARYIK